MTPEELTAVVPDFPLARSRKWAAPLTMAMEAGGITERKAVAAFIAQTGHETLSYNYVKELGGPKYFAKYEGRKDLGNDKPGDGVKYPGRGLIQITGKTNTLAVSLALFGDDRLLKTPELLEQPEWACKSAVWFWNSRKLTPLASAGEFEKVTRKINGGVNGLDDRKLRYERALSVLL